MTLRVGQFVLKVDKILLFSSEKQSLFVVVVFYFVSCLFFLFSHLRNFPLSPGSLDRTLVAIGYISASSSQASSTLIFGSHAVSFVSPFAF